jgi:hypothetical protein
VGITNTINLIDGLDGLAAGLAAIAGLSIAYVAYIHGDKYGMMVVCLAMMCLAGSCAGFLPFNFHPAKTFMGELHERCIDASAQIYKQNCLPAVLFKPPLIADRDAIDFICAAIDEIASK